MPRRALSKQRSFEDPRYPTNHRPFAPLPNILVLKTPTYPTKLSDKLPSLRDPSKLKCFEDPKLSDKAIRQLSDSYPTTIRQLSDSPMLYPTAIRQASDKHIIQISQQLRNFRQEWKRDDCMCSYCSTVGDFSFACTMLVHPLTARDISRWLHVQSSLNYYITQTGRRVDHVNSTSRGMALSLAKDWTCLTYGDVMGSLQSS